MTLSLTYDEVPKDIRENLRYRAAVLAVGDAEPLARPAILEAASKDFLWWVNTFCWIFEPRPDDNGASVIDGKVRPFVTWPNQDAAYREVQPIWGRSDIGIIKSRAQGASWVFLAIMLHGWRFREMEAYGLVSRNEAMVDNPRDPNSLMWKLDWEISKLPAWMIDPKDVERNRGEHALLYRPTGSTIIGNSATGDVARGGRATAFLMDEFAAFKQPDDVRALDSTRDVTKCRIFLSTPQGPVGAYYDIMRNPGNMTRIGMWWHENPTQNKGLYRVVQNKVKIVDYDYWMRRSGLETKEQVDIHAGCVAHLDDENAFKYGFMLTGEFVKEGALRSPWYDTQCQRPGTTPRSISQELDGDFGGSMTRFFDVQRIDKLCDACRPPIFTGDFLWDHLEPKRTKPIDGGKGYLNIFGSFLLGQRTPDSGHEYTIGVDIAAGSGGHDGSNSVIEVCDATIKEIVAEYAAPNIPPHELAELAYCLGHFYAGDKGLPVIIPEINGLGMIFLNRLKELNYPNIYRRRVEDRRSRQITQKLGFQSGRTTKAMLLGEFNRAICAGELTVRSRACLEETKQYMLLANGAIEHVGASSSEDPSGAGENHGDRVIAAACAWKAATELGIAKQLAKNAARNSTSKNLLTIAGRMNVRDAQEKAAKSNSW